MFGGRKPQKPIDEVERGNNILAYIIEPLIIVCFVILAILVANGGSLN